MFIRSQEFPRAEIHRHSEFRSGINKTFSECKIIEKKTSDLRLNTGKKNRLSCFGNLERFCSFWKILPKTTHKIVLNTSDNIQKGGKVK